MQKCSHVPKLNELIGACPNVLSNYMEVFDMFPKWRELPDSMRNQRVRIYYESLYSKQRSLKLKRAFDVFMSTVLIIMLSPLFVLIAIMIKKDSKGPVFFKQTRVTAFDRDFTIYKFRSMVTDAPKIGTAVTVSNDTRITSVGKKLRKYRLDELPQLFNVLKGEMSFVGTRPEVRKYVNAYSPEMMATLLLPAGITSEASIRYKEEDKLLDGAKDADMVYIHKILPVKMRYNLSNLRTFSCFSDACTMVRTVLAMLK